MDVSPPGKAAWSDKFKWADIERICFEATDYMFSDDLYFFTAGRSESYVIPTEAKGGCEIWQLVIEKSYLMQSLRLKQPPRWRAFFVGLLLTVNLRQFDGCQN